MYPDFLVKFLLPGISSVKCWLVTTWEHARNQTGVARKNPEWKAFVSDKTMQIQKPIKTNPHTNAYLFNTKTQFPSFQNHW
jgi:hypothetical protein